MLVGASASLNCSRISWIFTTWGCLCSRAEVEGRVEEEEEEIVEKEGIDTYEACLAWRWVVLPVRVVSASES